jgi:CheY-like chemotaxis protein
MTTARAKGASTTACAEADMAKTILIADDNPTIRKVLCRLFEAEEGYEVCAEAANGREAIDLALECLPNLIILDLSMPVMDGLAAARELKVLMPDVPIILFTQYADLGKHLLGPDVPVDRVVSKSDTEQLVVEVRALLPV